MQVLLASMTMLALSSMSKSSRFVGIMYAGLMFFTSALFNAVRGITGRSSPRVAVAERGARTAGRCNFPSDAALRPAGGSGALLVIVALIGHVRLHPRAARARASRWCSDDWRRSRSSHAEQLSKWYGQVSGLNDVTVKIPQGITGLLGPNGAGKSTFMKLMTGQLKPSKGSIRVLGEADLGQPRCLFHASASVRSRTPSTTG